MKRRLFAILAVFSLAIWFVVLTGWIRSRFYHDVAWFTLGQRLIVFRQETRSFQLWVVHDWTGKEPDGWDSYKVDPSRGSLPTGPNLIALSNYRTSHWELAGIGAAYDNAVGVVFRNNQLPMRMFLNRGAAAHTALTLSIRWPTALILPAILPLIWLMQFVRHRRQVGARARHGLCRNCGYDLRASTGRCPECGTVIPANPNLEPQINADEHR